VVGGGVLGVAEAALLARMGMWGVLVCRQEFVWEKFGGINRGGIVGKYLEHRGVKIHYGEPVAKLEGDGRVQRVVLGNGEEIECDFAVAAVGMTPNKEVLRGTAIAAEKAILVDE